MTYRTIQPTQTYSRHSLRGVAELANTDLDCIERLYQSLRARVCPVCVSEDVQKEHSLNVGMMKMEELRRAFILS